MQSLRNLASLTICVVSLCPAPLRAQDPPASAPPSSQPQPKPKKNVDSAVNSAPDQPQWDPLRAEKDLEVGKYYMKKGDVDAAIDRFEDATTAKPTSATWISIPTPKTATKSARKSKNSTRKSTKRKLSYSGSDPVGPTFKQISCHPEGRAVCALKDLNLCTKHTFSVEILRLSSSDSLRRTDAPYSSWFENSKFV
jgi:hypothetical protein